MKIARIKSPITKNIKLKESTSSILKSILGFVGIFIVSAIVAEICIIILFTCIGINIFEKVPNNILTQTMPLFGFAFFTAGTILFCKFIEKRSMQSMGFIRKRFIINYLKGIIIGTILISVVLLGALATRALTYDGVSKDINWLFITMFLFGYIIQGMAEEVMCRGYLMTTLSKKTSTFWAIILSSLAFTALHIFSLLAIDIKFGIIGFVNTMLFSIFVSILMVKTKNIWIVSAIHSSWNFILGIFCGISVSGQQKNISILNFTVNESKDLINGGTYGLEAGIITTIILIMGIVILIRINKASDGAPFAISTTSHNEKTNLLR